MLLTMFPVPGMKPVNPHSKFHNESVEVGTQKISAVESVITVGETQKGAKQGVGAGVKLNGPLQLLKSLVSQTDCT